VTRPQFCFVSTTAQLCTRNLAAWWQSPPIPTTHVFLFIDVFMVRCHMEATVSLPMQVAKSPVAPAVGFSYDIGAGGLQLLDGEPMPTLALGGSLAFPVSNEMF